MRTHNPRYGTVGARTASPVLLTGRELRRIQRAEEFAAERHAGQLRAYDGAPFIEHPRDVARVLAECGADEPLLVAGLLHDVLEKTSTSESELRASFGQRVGGLVLSVTADDTIDDSAARITDLRRRVAAGGPASGLLFGADRIAKLPELDTPVDAVRAEHERESLALLERLIPRGPLVRRLRAGLEAADIVSNVRPLRPYLSTPVPLTSTKETS